LIIDPLQRLSTHAINLEAVKGLLKKPIARDFSIRIASLSRRGRAARDGKIP
jgi:hypothetical protein